jgi:hypothetical protein
MTYENQTTANANVWTLCALVFAEKQCGNQTLQHNCMRDGRAEHCRDFGINLLIKMDFLLAPKVGSGQLSPAAYAGSSHLN